ncbi:MAG: mechanosensitive ion channel [Candidatus Omnitrophica bacterium]|nr:mechanosensitive ion channel [Candidatus Omnitrophota bacterium]
MKKISNRISWEVIKKSFLPVLMLVSLIMGYVYYKMNVMPVIHEKTHLELMRYIGSLFVISIAFIMQTILTAIVSWYEVNIVSKTATKLDDKLIPIMRRTLKVIIWVVAVLVILPFFGVNISALVATLGVCSLAIALAAQDTIANVISGFMIMIDSPFRIGDKIKLPSGEVVIVLDIGVRRSEFLSGDKAIVIVPNLDLSKSKIVNYTYGEERAK